MRVVERNMINAINNRKNFSCGNTVVDVGETGISVYLHGHRIATITQNNVSISACSWCSNTTKSRLNVILNEYTTSGISQKNWVWTLHNTSDGNVEMKSNREYTLKRI